MIIDPEVATVARHWRIDPSLIQAMVTAEGGINHIVRAVQCSVPSVTTVEEALDITCRTVCHAMNDFISLSHRDAFVRFLGARWAPLRATNDPHHLNANWVPNVLKGWHA